MRSIGEEVYFMQANKIHKGKVEKIFTHTEKQGDGIVTNIQYNIRYHLDNTNDDIVHNINHDRTSSSLNILIDKLKATIIGIREEEDV